MIATACVLVAALLAATPATTDAVRWSHLDGRDSGKLASGPSSWSAESNLKRTSDLTPESWWGNDSSWNRYSYVRNNPARLIDPRGAEVELANRPVDDFPLANHAYVVVTPTGKNAEVYKDRINKEGHIVLSGGPGFIAGTGNPRTSLVKWTTDLRSAAKQLIVVEPTDQTMEQFERNVIEAFDSYVDGSLPYNNVDVGGKNSNAFASGVLDAAGAGQSKPRSRDLNGWNPGWSDPIDLPDARENDTAERNENE